MKTLLSSAALSLILATGCSTAGSLGNALDTGGAGGAGGTGGGGSASSSVSTGSSLYAASCSGCHGGGAQGASGPALAGISDTNRVIDIILYGNGGMPGFASSLSDADVSDILAYLSSLG